MLPRMNRLTRSQDYRRVYEEGRSFSTAHLLAKAAQRSGGAATRIGVVVSTKVSKKAVERNKTRRRIREALRNSELVNTRGFDIIFSARPSIKNCTFSEITRECGLIERRFVTSPPT